jgi:hypothetical protein
MDSDWRVLPDPELQGYEWRRVAFVLEYRVRWVGDQQREPWVSSWYNQRDYPQARLFSDPTPEREALWLELLLRP